MLGVGHVDIGDDIYDSAVGLFREAFVLATVAGLHVEDGDVEALGSNDAKAAVSITKNEDCIRLGLIEEFVGAVDDVTTGSTKIIANGIHVHLRIGKLQVAEEDAIEVVVIVLTGVSKDYIEILAAGVDDGCKADDLRTGSDNDTELEFTVLLPLYITIIEFGLFIVHSNLLFYRIKECVRTIRIEDFVAVHDGNEILSV